MTRRSSLARRFDTRVIAEFGRLCHKCDAALMIEPPMRRSQEGHPDQERHSARIIRSVAPAEEAD